MLTEGCFGVLLLLLGRLSLYERNVENLTSCNRRYGHFLHILQLYIVGYFDQHCANGVYLTNVYEGRWVLP